MPHKNPIKKRELKIFTNMLFREGKAYLKKRFADLHF